MSSLRIVHRNLACRNVLICANKILKISNFGLARQLSEELVYYGDAKEKLPIRWMAPETIKDYVFNACTDTYEMICMQYNNIIYMAISDGVME